MSDPISGTGLAGGALTGASVYGLLTGTDYGVVFGAFAGAVFYIATAADLSASRRLAYFIVSYIAGILCSGLVGSKLANLTGYTLRKAHRTGAKFMMNNNSLFAIRLLKDSEGNYLWRPGLELGQPSSLAGYGIAENEQMPDIAADAKAIAFGNFKRGYTIVDRIGTRILRDPYTNKPFVGFYTTKRTGGMLVDSQAIKLLKIAAA
ncbi:phage major capsid protein [Escherichia coli]|nr:phage major capsid protein [Escherichia coli]